MPRKPPRDPQTLNVLLSGNAQANAIADAFISLESLSQYLNIVYVRTDELANRTDCDLLLLQVTNDDVGGTEKVPVARNVVRFPDLHLSLLWPLSCVNPYDVVEPPRFPHGRFPYGDGYVVNCVGKGTRPEEILPFCIGNTWPANWPNLDRMFLSENSRFATLEKRCDVKISSYIFKHFTKRRLFGSPHGPSRHLLAILARRIIEHFPTRLQSLPTSEEIENVLVQRNARRFLDQVEVPVHEAIAAHFRLAWHDREESYAHFGETLNAHQYFSRMIAHSYALKSSQTIR